MKLQRDPDDPDCQTLLLWYPAATQTDDYIRSAVKIEAGAKSLSIRTRSVSAALHCDDLPRLDLRVPNVTTVKAERTFWDKIIIRHGLRQWYDRRGVLRHGGQRVSRHHYGAHQLMRDHSSQSQVRYAPAFGRRIDGSGVSARCGARCRRSSSAGCGYTAHRGEGALAHCIEKRSDPATQDESST